MKESTKQNASHTVGAQKCKAAVSIPPQLVPERFIKLPEKAASPRYEKYTLHATPSLP